MRRPLGVGVVGCGDVSKTYFALAPLFRDFEIVACTDLRADAAAARAAAFGVRALPTPEALIGADAVEAVLNLTPPAAHGAVARAALDAGKHVYSEKPLALSAAEAHDLADAARAADRRIGVAPDTFLGGAHQAARAALDAGAIGRVVGGTCHVMGPGMEGWHPNPDFFFRPGGGPVFDMGPYYLTALVDLLGPVRRVAAMDATARTERVIGTGPRAGAVVRVETPTTVHALLSFESGAVVTLGASWDVAAHGHPPIELYGTDGTLALPDPNFFGGAVVVSGPAPSDRSADAAAHPLGRINETPAHGGGRANYRGAGLADMAAAIRTGRAHRCSLELGVHVVEILEAVLASARTGRFVDPVTRVARPDPLPADAAADLLAD